MIRIALLCLIPCLVNAQEIALTFDDAPTADGPLLTGVERTTRLLDALRQHNVREVAFFILTNHINATTAERLKRYTDAGHLLANHSHHHFWIHEAGTAKYIRDIAVADSILRSYPKYQPWYRYPYLDEGRNQTARDSIRGALSALRLKNGYVTVDNYDWYLNALVRQAVDKKQQIEMDVLRDIYVSHIFNSVLFYDKIARQHIGRSPRHVLLLHENDLAALFLGDLINHLKAKGWKIISPREAYEDPISTQVPDVLFNGQGRVAAIAREKGIPARDLVQESEDEAYLDTLVHVRKVFRQ